MTEESPVSPPPAEPSRRRILFVPLVRLARIVWRLLPWLAFSALLVLVTGLLDASDPVRRQALGVAIALAISALVLAVGREILSPDRPALRLVHLSDFRARRFATILRVLVLWYFLTEIAAWLIQVNGWRSGVAELFRLLWTVVVILVVAGFLVTSGLVKKLRGLPADTWRGTIGRFLANVVFPLAVVVALFLAITLHLGYVPLARYVATNVVWSLVKLVVAILVFRQLKRALMRVVGFLRERETEDEVPDAAAADFDATVLGIERIASGILRLVVGIGATLWILAEWRISPGAIAAALSSPIVGSEGMTWGNLFWGLVRVGAVLFVGWLVRNILTYFVFPRSRVGVGARYAILAMLRYAVVAVAVVLGLGALGVDTSSLGWFFGAAGIGIGLGLQDIIGNFFSGLIMLVERPIRVGDVVTVGDAVGTVENIHMRGTTLRTFDNTTILIPNRQLLGERVTNNTFGMAHARVLVQIGVSYDANPERVREILLELGAEHPNVLADPAPNVWFSAFGESSLDFTLICHTDQVRGRFTVASELRHAIFRRLKAEGVEIPFPQRDLHLRSGWPPPSHP